MQDTSRIAVSDDEYRLINALQISPRVPWSVLGSVLGQDPVTLARHWARLERCGIALAAWLKSLEDLERLKTALTQQLAINVVDTSIVMRTPVHLHEWLNEDGLRMRDGDGAGIATLGIADPEDSD
jgi:hypothetical protein